MRLRRSSADFDYGNWVFDDNLRPFLEALGNAVGYRFDDDDWTAVEQHVLKGGSSGEDHVLDYPLKGSKEAKLRLLYEPGGSVVSFQLWCDPETVAQARALVFLAQSYDIKAHS